jgi:hypothetical protein
MAKNVMQMRMLSMFQTFFSIKNIVFSVKTIASVMY